MLCAQQLQAGQCGSSYRYNAGRQMAHSLLSNADTVTNLGQSITADAEGASACLPLVQELGCRALQLWPADCCQASLACWSHIGIVGLPAAVKRHVSVHTDDQTRQSSCNCTKRTVVYLDNVGPCCFTARVGSTSRRACLESIMIAVKAIRCFVSGSLHCANQLRTICRIKLDYSSAEDGTRPEEQERCIKRAM